MRTRWASHWWSTASLKFHVVPCKAQLGPGLFMARVFFEGALLIIERETKGNTEFAIWGGVPTFNVETPTFLG